MVHGGAPAGGAAGLKVLTALAWSRIYAVMQVRHRENDREPAAGSPAASPGPAAPPSGAGAAPGRPAPAPGDAAIGELATLFRLHADLCKALASEHRLAILFALRGGERCVTELADLLGLPLHNVSQHLRVLRERMLVAPRREGQTIYYRITNPKFVQACTLIREALIEQHEAEGRTLVGVEALAALTASEEAGAGTAAATQSQYDRERRARP